jgi:hypothetical protein
LSAGSKGIQQWFLAKAIHEHPDLLVQDNAYYGTLQRTYPEYVKTAVPAFEDVVDVQYLDAQWSVSTRYS